MGAFGRGLRCGGLPLGAGGPVAFGPDSVSGINGATRPVEIWKPPPRSATVGPSPAPGAKKRTLGPPPPLAPPPPVPPPPVAGVPGGRGPEGVNGARGGNMFWVKMATDMNMNV